MVQHVSKVRLGDIGVRLQLQVVDQNGDPVDVSTADLLEITMRKPDGTPITREADPVTDDPAVINVFEILSEAGDFDQVGTTWRYQGHVGLPDGTDVHTRPVGFEVEALLA